MRTGLSFSAVKSRRQCVFFFFFWAPAVTKRVTVRTVMDSAFCLWKLFFLIQFCVVSYNFAALCNIFPKYLKVRSCLFLPPCSVSSLRLAELSLTPSDSQQITSCFSNSRCTQRPNDVSSNSYDSACDGVLFNFERKSTNNGFQSIRLESA